MNLGHIIALCGCCFWQTIFPSAAAHFSFQPKTKRISSKRHDVLHFSSSAAESCVQLWDTFRSIEKSSWSRRMRRQRQGAEKRKISFTNNSFPSSFSCLFSNITELPFHVLYFCLLLFSCVKCVRRWRYLFHRMLIAQPQQANGEKEEEKSKLFDLRSCEKSRDRLNLNSSERFLESLSGPFPTPAITFNINDCSHRGRATFHKKGTKNTAATKEWANFLIKIDRGSRTMIITHSNQPLQRKLSLIAIDSCAPIWPFARKIELDQLIAGIVESSFYFYSILCSLLRINCDMDRGESWPEKKFYMIIIGRETGSSLGTAFRSSSEHLTLL